MNAINDPKDSKRRGPGVEEGPMGNDRSGEPIENTKSESVQSDAEDARKTRKGLG
jgi:hypothetical protein